MQTIYKYRLGRENNKPVRVPMIADAIVLHLDYDPGTQEFCVWAIVLTENTDSEIRTFYVAGTGRNLADNLKGDEEMLQLNSFMVQPNRQPDHPVGWFHAFEVGAEDA